METKLSNINNRLESLSFGQLALLDSIIDTFQQPIFSHRNVTSDVVSPEFLIAFGDILKLHHSLSNEYLDKYRFEAAMERVMKALGRDVSRPRRNHPGHDLTVAQIPWSLKTQGDSNIKQDYLHISKFMELGKGKWEDESDLRGLRDQFLVHMNSYARMFQLRYFHYPLSVPGKNHSYELVEIPLKLLKEARVGEFSMMHASKQVPKPGYCTVKDKKQEVKFKLYFDGGTERKLQIKHLRKSLCIVHATWEF